MDLLFTIALFGLVVDWYAIRRGAARPATAEIRAVLIAIAACLATVVALALLGSEAGALGTMTGFLIQLVAIGWSVARWRIRRRARRQLAG